MSRFFVRNGRFHGQRRFCFRCFAVKMGPRHAEVNGDPDGHHRCGAQNPYDKQNLDHHRYSEYQIEVHRL